MTNTLVIAGITGNSDTVSANDVKKIGSEITEDKFSLLEPGCVGRLNAIIRIAKFPDGSKTDLYPARQGMQYMKDRLEGRAIIAAHDINQ